MLKRLSLLSALVLPGNLLAVEPGVTSDEYTETHTYTGNAADVDFRIESFYGNIVGQSIRTGATRPTSVFAQSPRFNFFSNSTVVSRAAPQVSYSSTSTNLAGNIPLFTVEFLIDGESFKSQVFYTGDLNKSCSESFNPPSQGVCSLPHNRFLDECRRYYSTSCRYSGLKSNVVRDGIISFSHVSNFHSGSTRLRFKDVHPKANLGLNYIKTAQTDLGLQRSPIPVTPIAPTRPDMVSTSLQKN